MDRELVIIHYDKNVSDAHLEEVKTSLNGFEIEAKKRGIQCGSIDFSSTIDIFFAFALYQFFSGMLTEAGKETWQHICKKVANFPRNNYEINGGPALIFSIEEHPIYVIERFNDGNEEFYLNSIPNALLKVYYFFQNFNDLEDIGPMQVFQDPITKKWKYLFLPSTKSFGAYIDRIVDLDTFKLHEPLDHQDFIEHYCGNCSGNCCLVCAKYHRGK